MLDAEVVRGILQYFVVPVWIAAGFADWLCHRVTRIEKTSGSKESVLHLVMLAELGIPVCVALLLEINALILAFLIGAFVLHQLTALWDLRRAVGVRYISPIEQQVHSFLELMPLCAALLMVILHWPQFLALFGLGNEAADFSIRLKGAPLSWRYVIGVLGAVALFNLAPYLEELVRCWVALRYSGESQLARSR